MKKALIVVLTVVAILATVVINSNSQSLNGASSIIGLTASQIPNVITNTQTGVTLSGTFIGYGPTNGVNGATATNIALTAITNYVAGSQTYTGTHNGTHNGTVNGIPASSMTNAYTGIITNQISGFVTNRVYISYGIVTNVTYP